MQINDSCQRCRFAFFIISKKGKVCKTTLLNLENGFWYACTFGTETLLFLIESINFHPWRFDEKSHQSQQFLPILSWRWNLICWLLHFECVGRQKSFVQQSSEQGHIRIFFSVLSARHLQVWNSCRNRINDSMRQSAPYFFIISKRAKQALPYYFHDIASEASNYFSDYLSAKWQNIKRN